MHLVPGRVLQMLQIGTKFNRSSTRVKEMDTVHPIYLILIICAPQWRSACSIVLKIPIHVLHPLLPPPVSHTQWYGLRPRVHDRTLPEKTSNLVNCNFIIRMLYLNAYWLNIGLRYKYVIFYCMSSLYLSLCVKMRYVILSIKRLFIDWLIDCCDDIILLWQQFPCFVTWAQSHTLLSTYHSILQWTALLASNLKVWTQSDMRCYFNVQSKADMS